jgi:hypothetical protein
MSGFPCCSLAMDVSSSYRILALSPHITEFKKFILNKFGEGLRTGFFWLSIVFRSDSCEYGNEQSRSIREGNFFTI